MSINEITYSGPISPLGEKSSRIRRAASGFMRYAGVALILTGAGGAVANLVDAPIPQVVSGLEDPGHPSEVILGGALALYAGNKLRNPATLPDNT